MTATGTPPARPSTCWSTCSPEAVAFPADERDVVAVVDYARERGLRIAPQSTGHNAGPLGSLDGTLLVNTSKLTGVSIDASAQQVRVGSATKWESVAPQLSDLGLAGLHGSSPDVGIAGYSLGGGMGWLARKHGLQTNSVTAIELVTAEGHLVRADAVHEPDLFWALRGGGGNFGVVTAIEFDVYPVEEVYAGAMFFPFERASELLAHVAGAAARAARGAHDLGEPVAVSRPARGPGARARRLVRDPHGGVPGRGGRRPRAAASRARARARDGHLRHGAARSSSVSLALEDWLEPLPFLSAHQLLGELPAAAIDDLVAAGAQPGSPLGMLQLRHMGGALARKPPGAGARATLPGELSMFALGVAGDEASAAGVRATLEAVEDALRPHQVGHYPNFVEEPSDASAFFDPDTWARLREVKALYDPDDLFKGNHHIPPAS